jgi:hypothetical protein
MTLLAARYAAPAPRALQFALIVLLLDPDR